MKEQDKTARKKPNEMEKRKSTWQRVQSNGHKVANQTQDSKNVNKELEKYKEPKRMKNTITKMKYILERIHSRLDDRTEWISYLEDRIAEITQSQQQKRKKNWTLRIV